MNKMTPTNFPVYLDAFLNKYLPEERNCSENTFKSYCDTFSLLLQFIRDNEHINAERLTLEDFNHTLIERFLGYIEKERECSISTRNVRLAAIHSFFRYIQYEHPGFLLEWQKILGIPFKKVPHRIMNYLTSEGMRVLLSMPDQQLAIGRRDLALLSVMCSTGCRVQELCDLTPGSLRFAKPYLIKVIGKGNKARQVPLRDDLVILLKGYMDEHGLLAMSANRYPLFPNKHGNKLTRQAVTKILDKHIAVARNKRPELIPDVFSPHCLRHSVAMALLQTGVPLIYIRDLLGHVSIRTTEGYLRNESKQSREALEKAFQNIVPSLEEEKNPWERDRGVIAWLNGFKGSKSI
ncbi:tyrosine-type recombinase/integrase [Sphaerochaeta sp.]|jgi:site-specific recombinase XerD|uniref:tyrosine-type recombinase/integrase n=1 Tax=Sphaerochaeta sp. TaxID=1972642 RepID=UPI002A35B5DF|nr:tyrosine-type recombinase/integrase [Sphaerochaeta sp.]MDX9985426.1 tyrosine-type recombinase/integrase [Sphaerochaeta sp.]